MVNLVENESCYSIGRMLSKSIYLNKIKDSGILCVEIKFIDIQKNTKSEGNFMGFYSH